MLPGDEFDDLFEGLNVIAGFEGMGETEVDFLLARRHFVMGGLDDESEFFEFEGDVPADVFATIDRGKIEVRPLVDGIEGRLAVFLDFEKEELGLKANVKVSDA